MLTGSGIPRLLATLRGEGFGIEDGHASQAADGAALVMLGVIFFVISLLAAFAWTMRRRSRRPDPTLVFLQDLKQDSVPADPADASDRPRDAWERPPDWWKAE